MIENIKQLYFTGSTITDQNKIKTSNIQSQTKDALVLNNLSCDQVNFSGNKVAQKEDKKPIAVV